MDFIYLFRVLLKKKWLILGSAIIAALIAYFLTQNESKQYKSSAQLSTGFTMEDGTGLNQKNTGPIETQTRFNNVLVTFTSPSVISLLSYDLILHDLENPNPYVRLKDEDKNSNVYKQVNIESAKAVFREKLNTMQPLTSYKPEEKKLLEFLGLYGYDYKSINKHLAVYRVGNTDYMQIDYLSKNPELSAFVANDLYKQFTRYYRNITETRSQESIDTLRSIMDKRKQELDVKSALLRNSGYVSPEISGPSTYDLIATLTKDLNDEKTRKTQKEYELKKIDQRLAALSSGGSSNTNSTNSELIAARKAMNDAAAEWDQSPKSRILEERYKQAQTDYNNLVVKLGNNSSTPAERPTETKSELLNRRSDVLFDIDASARSISSMEGRIGSLQGTANRTASQGQTTEALKKEWEQANQDFLDAKQRYNSASDVSGTNLNNFRQVVFGQPAIEPEPSKRAIIIAMGATAAMVTTMLIIILLTYLDSSIKTPAIFTRSVNLKLISMINFMDLKNKDLADIVANRDGSDNAHDRTKFNAFRESIRKLRYEIESSRKKVFLFTSTKKGQGKTTLIQALSYSMSLSKKKILIIDTNFCNNDLTVQLQADPVLEKIVPFKQDASALLEQVRVVSKDIGVGTVYAIGSEGGDYTPSEILPRENLLQHLQSLTSEFDYIFLEGPPLNDFSDSKELAEYVEGVIAVFSAKQIIKQIDKQSISFFKELNGKFCGSILNMVDMENVNAA